MMMKPLSKHWHWLSWTKATQPPLEHKSSPTDQLKCCKKWRMSHLHQTAKQASHYYSNTRWRSLLKLQSRSTSTPHRDRDCHPAGDKTKEGCAPHRLPICTSITRIRKSRRLHLTKFKQPDIKNNSVLQWIPAHTGIHGNEVADQLAKEGSKKQQPKSKLSYQEAKRLIRSKRLADIKHRNGGYDPQQDTLRLLSRHKQTMFSG